MRCRSSRQGRQCSDLTEPDPALRRRGVVPDYSKGDQPWLAVALARSSILMPYRSAGGDGCGAVMTWSKEALHQESNDVP
jgi:hypothetical protein